MRSIIFVFTLSLICLSACKSVNVSDTGAADPLNIIFIFTDDHGYQAISAYGSNVNKTPNIDRLATEGMRFDRYWVFY